MRQANTEPKVTIRPRVTRFYRREQTELIIKNEGMGAAENITLEFTKEDLPPCEGAGYWQFFEDGIGYLGPGEEIDFATYSHEPLENYAKLFVDPFPLTISYDSIHGGQRRSHTSIVNLDRHDHYLLPAPTEADRMVEAIEGIAKVLKETLNGAQSSGLAKHVDTLKTHYQALTESLLLHSERLKLIEDRLDE